MAGKDQENNITGYSTWEKMTISGEKQYLVRMVLQFLPKTYNDK